MKDRGIIKLVADNLERHGFEVNSIPTSDKKTPDLLVKKDGRPYFYCEVKNPILQRDEDTGLYKHATTNSKLREFISKARRQLMEHDAHHSLPWSLVFVSRHFQLNWNNLGNCIQGFVGNKLPIVADLRGAEVVKRTNDDIRALDLMMWLQVGPDDNIYQRTIFINDRSEKTREVKLIADTLMSRKNDRHDQRISFE